jgi:hypothetical protein
MANREFRMPTVAEIQILEQNGVNPEGIAVMHRDEDSLIVLRHKTRDRICVYRGDKKWPE